jgi:hypothetical protein
MRFILKLIILLTLFALSCSQGEPELDPSSTSLIIESSVIYSIDDLISAGWKKDREFDNSEYPETVEIAYGFFERKDIEAWVYKSADEAKKFGVDYGEQAVDKKPGQTDYLIPRVNRYHAYVIIGNLMLLCETEILDCQNLIEKLPE